MAKECRHDLRQVASSRPIALVAPMNEVRTASGLIAPASRRTPRAIFAASAQWRYQNGSMLTIWATLMFPTPVWPDCYAESARLNDQMVLVVVSSDPDL